MLEELKEIVLEANLELPKKDLVTYTWGNVSGVDRDKGLVVIKPSGVPYEKLKVSDMVIVDMEGNRVEGELNPSSDTPTHLVLYKRFKDLGGIVHTHSTYATIWSQAGKSLPAFGTTHADYFYDEIPCTRVLNKEEIQLDYEKSTGSVIIETFETLSLETRYVPGVFVNNHGPFAWGKDPMEAVHNAVVLEEICKMGIFSKVLTPELNGIDPAILDKHFMRKHGENAYYGQK